VRHSQKAISGQRAWKSAGGLHAYEEGNFELGLTLAAKLLLLPTKFSKITEKLD